MVEYFSITNKTLTGRETLDELRAMSDPVVHPSPWQPIETAPKDRYILLFSPSTPDWDGNMYVAKWFGDEGDGLYWTCGGPNGGLDCYLEFTHWMPLPEAPPL